MTFYDKLLNSYKCRYTLNERGKNPHTNKQAYMYNKVHITVTQTDMIVKTSRDETRNELDPVTVAKSALLADAMFLFVSRYKNLL